MDDIVSPRVYAIHNSSVKKIKFIHCQQLKTIESLSMQGCNFAMVVPRGKSGIRYLCWQSSKC